MDPPRGTPTLTLRGPGRARHRPAGGTDDNRRHRRSTGAGDASIRPLHEGDGLRRAGVPSRAHEE
ncbi:hypothetical protein GCM10017559_11640 [Streptosporangium longisporum]|uniref:Uncharacterized protein n=1 Tax=Streptosporangium longisporum TaxID=46187 RepID=A0ABP6KCC1_9ACTN